MMFRPICRVSLTDFCVLAMATAPTDNVGNIQSPDAASPSDDLQELTYDAFLKVGEYLGGELEGNEA